MSRRGNLPTGCPAKAFPLAAKIPLITIKELQKEVGKLHYQHPKSYQEKASLRVSELAAKRAAELYI